MARIIEAEARISAVDATGRTFEQIAQKVRGLHSAFKSLSGVTSAGIGNVNRTIGHIQHAVHTLAPAAAAGAAMEGARGLSGLVHETVKMTAERAHEAVRMQVAGFTEAELDEALRISQEVSEKTKALSTTTIMHSLRNLRTIVGSFDEAAKLITPIAKLRVLTLGAHPERAEELEASFDRLEKSQEMVGATQDPARFRRNMELVAKAMNTFGDTLKPDEFFNFAKYARQAGQNYTDRFLLGVAPTLMQEMGGKSAGEALSSFFQQFVAGKMPQYAAAMLDKYGLIADRSKIEFNKAGKIKRLEPGAIKDFELAKLDPYRWIQEVYLPALAAHGITSKEQIANVTSTIASKRTTGQAMGIFATQQQRIEKDLAMTGGAKGLEAADTFVAHDPMMAWAAVTKQFENLLAVAGGPLAEPAAQGLNLLAGAITALERAAVSHPLGGAAGLAVALVLAAGALGAPRGQHCAAPVAGSWAAVLGPAARW
jgi:hypothetical protein